MRSKKLLILLGSLGRGGAERVISILSDYFCDNGWDVTIALLLFNKVEYELNSKIKIFDLSGKMDSRIKRLPEWIFGIRRLVKNENPDVILSFTARISIITQVACLGLNKKIIVSERNDPYCDGRSKLVDVMTRWLYPKARVVVFQTKRAQSYFKKYKLQKSVIISNPISVKCFAREPQKGKIVTIGRLEKQKNQKLLIDAFSEVLKKIPYATLYIFGDGSLKDSLINQAREFGILNQVHFMGNVTNIHEQVADAELFVLSSDYEGLSNALLEAMMMGLACISTDCAGSDEYIQDRRNGLLVHVGDREGLVSAMVELLQNRDFAYELGKNARKLSTAFAKEKVLRQWNELIDGECNKN